MAIVDAVALKAWMGIGDTIDDVTVAAAAAAADRQIKGWCRREFADTVTPTARWFEAVSPELVIVDDFHTDAGLVVATDDDGDGAAETVWAATDFQAEPANRTSDGITWPFTSIRALSGRFPRGRRRTQVSVTARWGFAVDVPDDVTLAGRIQGSRLLRRKDTPDGIAGTGEFGVVRVAGRPDPDVVQLLARYRRAAVAGGAVLVGG